jgi:hypothetical protein
MKLFIVLLIILICMMPAIGWCMNVYKFTQCDFKAPYKAEVIRFLGIFPFAPVGCVLGFIDIKD